MLSLFKFRRSKGPADLTLGMSGVRLGERLLQVGPGDPAAFAAMAGKVGLTGQASAVVASIAEGTSLESAAAEAGVLVEVSVAQATAWPFETGSFDVAVVDANQLLARDAGAQDAVCGDIQRVVRGGGRVLVVYRRSLGLAGRLGFEADSLPEVLRQQLMQMVSRAGFGPVRFLADREGLAFVEAFRPRSEARDIVPS